MAPLLAIGLVHYLVVGAALFCAGLVTVMSRRNAIAILIGIELMLNAANLNLVAFDRYGLGGIRGQLFALFVLVIAAAEAAVALAIVLAMFRNFGTVYADAVQSLKR